MSEAGQESPAAGTAAGGNQSLKWKEENPVSSLLIIMVATLACLLPFLGKAFHMDDPLFVWCARHIQSDPVHFYSFNVNWEGRPAPMAAVTQNPPLTAFFMALAGSLLGWKEAALHAAFLLPALALAAGTWRLARGFCAHPLAAALVTITAPVFLLSSTSTMCDTMMLAFWVWAVVFWTEGLTQNRPAKLWAAAVLIAACGLTKYFGLCLIPLLLVYSLMERRRAGVWLACLLFPVVVMAGYQWMTHQLYGRGLLFNAAAYATNLRIGDNLPVKILTGLAFSGGCILIVLPLAPLLWGRKALAAGLFGVVLIGALVVALKKLGRFPVLEAGHVKWLFVAQFSLWVASGAGLLLLAAQDWRERKTAGSLLLLLWVAGTFLFACAVNWTVNGRTILPMLPAVSLLLIRRLERRNWLDGPNILGRLWGPLAISLAIALLVSWADYRLADSARTAAANIRQQAGATAGALWFEGHWGFQYYMEQQGAQPLDRDNLRLSLNDAIVLPLGSSYLFPLSRDHAVPWFTYECNPSPWLTTMSVPSGAGYYSDGWGPLPFVFCRVPAEQYVVLRVQ
jgi:4-amino-4-deoxy-L-arabinose transferase-like glycosyltransferase